MNSSGLLRAMQSNLNRGSFWHQVSEKSSQNMYYCQSDGPHCHLEVSPAHQRELREKILQTLLSMRIIKLSVSPPLLSVFVDKMHIPFKAHSRLSVCVHLFSRKRCETKLGMAIPRIISSKLERRIYNAVSHSCFNAWQSIVFSCTARGVCLWLQTALCLWDMGLLDRLSD